MPGLIHKGVPITAAAAADLIIEARAAQTAGRPVPEPALSVKELVELLAAAGKGTTDQRKFATGRPKVSRHGGPGRPPKEHRAMVLGKKEREQQQRH